MPIGNIGSRMAGTYATLSQNERADENQQMKKEDWELNRPLRQATSQLATAKTEDALLARDVDATSYGDNYGENYNYGLELKRRLDEQRNLKNMEMQMKALKSANKMANISADMADQHMITYGVDGNERDLSKIALHTSGNGQPSQDGFYTVGPYNMRNVRPENMSARQRAEMDRIRAERQKRVDAGIYKEETFADGVKRYVNSVSNDVIGQDIWLEDDKGKLYTPEHIKMVTGQTERASRKYQSTTPKSQVENTTSETTQPGTPSTTSGTTQPSTPSTQTTGTEEEAPVNLPPQPTDTMQTPVPGQEAQPATKQETTDIGQMYTDYEVQNPGFTKEMEKVTEKINTYPEGTAGAELINVLGAKGPEVDLRIKKAIEMYPTELEGMTPDQFASFLNKETTAAPATVSQAKEQTPLVDRLSTYVTDFISQAENNANKPKGAQKANADQQHFMAIASRPGEIEKAIADGVTSEKELHDWVKQTGKFKPMTASEKKVQVENELSDKMIDQVYSVGEDGQNKFDTAKYASMDAKEAMRAQNRLGKPSDLKEIEKQYQGAEEWYKVKDTIMSVSDKRLKLSEIGDSLGTMSDKWFGTFWDGDDGAYRFGQLEATMGKAVANQVKLMSGTAASDKERATILRYMFGDKGVSQEAFMGAISGYTKMVEDKLPTQAKLAFSKGGYMIGRDFSRLYEMNKGKSDVRPPKVEGKEETRLERLKRLKEERMKEGN